MFRQFVPKDFVVPTLLETDRVRLRPLTIKDVEKDYDAVISSIDHLQGTFGPGNKWPSADLTIDQDLADLGWHQKEFEMRSSFAYTVMSLDESACLGCAYLFPASAGSSFDAVGVCWVRASEADTGLDAHLFEAFSAFVKEQFPFERVAFPGRGDSWEGV